MSYRDIIDGLVSIHEAASTSKEYSYEGKPLKVGKYKVFNVVGVTRPAYKGGLEMKVDIKGNGYLKLPNSSITMCDQCSLITNIEKDDAGGYKVRSKVYLNHKDGNYDSDYIMGSDYTYLILLKFTELQKNYLTGTDLVVTGKTVRGLLRDTCKAMESYIKEVYLDNLKNYLSLDDAYKFLNSSKFSKIAKRCESGKYIYDDTNVVIYRNGKEVYSGIEDASPYHHEKWERVRSTSGVYYMYNEKKDPGAMYIMACDE